ncbi:MAG: hypothetical protein HY433_02055 [Candidatus Liptonbacteria bacterium]|nr:hypothetical protein [Candidatus Liptonbacteria bacterium]
MSYSEKVLPILRSARKILLPKWGIAPIFRHKSASGADVVTKLDIEVESRVAKSLQRLYPDIKFVGEERGGKRGGEKFWLMDPIDGTGHFVRGMPFCTTMLALVENGHVVFSAIYDFLNDGMYWAECGKGAFRNNKCLKVSGRPLKEAYVAVESRLETKKSQEMANRLEKETVSFHSVSCGWEFAMIAEGKLDGRISFDPWGYDWDFAPGSLLVSEAGGVVANIGSRKYDYRNTNLIATNQVIFRELTSGRNAIFPLRKR